MRGGGGSTFGVIISATIKAFPSTPYVTATAFLGTTPGNPGFWDVIRYILSQFQWLDELGISCYTFLATSFRSVELGIISPLDGFFGTFSIPASHPSNSSESLKDAIIILFTDATAPYPSHYYSSINAKTYPDFWAWYSVSNGPLDAGHHQILGSRLLDAKALTQNLTALKAVYKAIKPASSITSVYLVGGKNVMNAVPRGGINAVNPVWRKAYVHTLVSVSWSPFDVAGKAKQEDLLTNTYVEALRQLAPDMGAYMNEADPNEPNFQQAFWGENYPRLLDIKRRVDPSDVFWCTPCVGNDRWKVVDAVLCKV